MNNYKIQSITFGNKNTWDDWGLLAVDRPVFKPPKQKKYIIDIPFGNGVIDLSTSLTGFPVFENRTGTFQFRVYVQDKPWSTIYSEICNYIMTDMQRYDDEKKQPLNKVILHDDPDWFYTGSFSIDSYDSGDTWSTITISYDVHPYKYSTISSLDYWTWDDFNFNTGIFYDVSCQSLHIQNEITSATLISLDKDLIGDLPLSPIYIVRESENLEIYYETMGDSYDYKVPLRDGENKVPEIILYGKDSYDLIFFGNGIVDIYFRKGSL